MLTIEPPPLSRIARLFAYAQEHAVEVDAHHAPPVVER